MTMADINWSTLVSMTTLGLMLSGALYLLLHVRLSADFVSRREHEQILGRVGKNEEELKAMPNRDDMAMLRTQIAGVSERVGIVNASLDGLKNSQLRIEKMQDLLMQTLLEREKSS